MEDLLEMTANYYWGYFFSSKELVDIFVRNGGKLGRFKGNTVMSSKRAERSIFGYLWPGRIRVYYGCGGDDKAVPGMSFLIGRDNANVEQIEKGLLARCRTLFERDPDQFFRLDDPEDPEKFEFEWRREGRVIGRVMHLEFVEYGMIQVLTTLRRSDKYLEYDAFD
ncbi:hypothetical protein FRC07_014947 [Ceratobasidium sp. 392]|nr:hypothetical protein FRC07_014947 [Ceratobasidium sp. 392]